MKKWEKFQLVGGLLLAGGTLLLTVANPANLLVVGPAVIGTGILTKFALRRHRADPTP